MKSAKRLNRKLVKSRLTKKRRQVGRGVKKYTVTYNIGSNPQPEFEITVITDDEDKGYIDTKYQQIREKQLPTHNQFMEYVVNFLQGGKYYNTTKDECGLFLVIDPKTGALKFYKLYDGKINIIIPDGVSIDVGNIKKTLTINGINIEFTDEDDIEPVLIPKEVRNSTFSRSKTRVIKRGKSSKQPVNTQESINVPTIYEPTIYEQYKINEEPPARKNSSSNKSEPVINIEELYKKPVKPEAPALPPRKPPSYSGTGSIVKRVTAK